MMPECLLTFYRKADSGSLFPNGTKTINEVEVPLIILGDPAYPLLPWLMKPYIENSCTTTKERLFNYRQSRARMVVENAFGRLKGRWRCLLKRIDAQLSNVPNVVASCVTLHNICELYGDHCSDEWVVDERGATAAVASTQSGANSTNTTATEIRDAIKDFL